MKKILVINGHPDASTERLSAALPTLTPPARKGPATRSAG